MMKLSKVIHIFIPIADDSIKISHLFQYFFISSCDESL